MTVRGDTLVFNCRNCFSTHGYGINLKPQVTNPALPVESGAFQCPQCSSKYVVESGYMKRVN